MRKCVKCPRCRTSSRSHSTGKAMKKDTVLPGRLSKIKVTWDKYWCPRCKVHFTMITHLNGEQYHSTGGQYTPRAKRRALALRKAGNSFENVYRKTGIPPNTVHEWASK